jgi:hypothetical protein
MLPYVPYRPYKRKLERQTDVSLEAFILLIAFGIAIAGGLNKGCGTGFSDTRSYSINLSRRVECWGFGNIKRGNRNEIWSDRSRAAA